MSTFKSAKSWTLLAIIALMTGLLLSACGDPTATTAPATTAAATTAAAAQTTAAATTAASGAATTAAASGSTLQANPNVKGDITVWAWNIAAKSLASNVDGFKK